MPNKTRICIIRHGETPWNTEKRIQGHTDIGLNDEGVKQAAAAAQWIKRQHTNLKALYSSDLSRAWLTATAIGDGLNLLPIPEPSFRERKYGCFEGLTYLEAEKNHPQAYAQFHARIPFFQIPDGGESLVALHERVSGALKNIARKHLGQSIGIVCHGGVLDIINRFVRGKPLAEKRDFDIPNAAINWIVFEENPMPTWTIEVWGDTRHLTNPVLDELPG